GLNGGYTVVESWPNGLRNFFRTLAHVPGLTAEIVSPLPDSIHIKGDRIHWIAKYHEQFFGIDWTEDLWLRTTNARTGINILQSGYLTTATVQIRIKERKLGRRFPGFDHLFFKYGKQYGIPPDLLKSMALQESCCVDGSPDQGRIFDQRAYRYEAHKDYDWYSASTTDASSRIKRHPDRHIAIGGTALHGTVEQGDQLPSQDVYFGWSRHMSGYPNGLDTSGDTDGNLTAQELLNKNPDRVWIRYKDPGENWNFTAQLVVASSYGVLQAMYETALTRMVRLNLEKKRSANHPDERPQDAVPVTQLFDPDFSIKVGAGYLKLQYDENGHDWWTALRKYNGVGRGAENYADAVILKWNNGNGIFKEIIE
ncbi:MAG: hypothetical protein AAB415_01530, partial [Patescibacteria group bacterium]